MATLNLNIDVPDEKAQEILDAYAAHYGRDPASGQAKLAFLKQSVIEHIRNAWRIEKQKAGRQATDVAVNQEVNNTPMT